MEKKPDPLGKNLAKLLKVIFNLQSKVIRNFQSQVNSLQSELHTLARAQVETAELLQQQEEDLERERKYSDELKKKLRVSNNLFNNCDWTTLTSEPSRLYVKLFYFAVNNAINGIHNKKNDIWGHKFCEISVIYNDICELH